MTYSEQQTHKDWKQFEMQESRYLEVNSAVCWKSRQRASKNQTGLWQTHAGHHLFDLTMAVIVCPHVLQAIAFVWVQLTPGLPGCANNKENKTTLVLKQEAASPCLCFCWHLSSSVPGLFSQCGWSPTLHPFLPPDTSGRQQQHFS